MSIEKIERELREGLEGVTPGPWKPFVSNGVRAVMKGRRELIKWTGFDASDFPEAASKNARHIARCSPENIRALLDELSRLRGALRDILKANDDFRLGMPDDWEGDPLQDACEAARALSEREGQDG